MGMYREFDSLSGEEFENYCSQILRSEGYVDVWMTPKSGDFGIDIIAKKNGEKWGFQCKRYSGSVGIKAVQEVYAGKAHYGCDRVAVITNSSFSKPAKDLARKTNTALWDGEFINKLDHELNVAGTQYYNKNVSYTINCEQNSFLPRYSQKSLARNYEKQTYVTGGQRGTKLRNRSLSKRTVYIWLIIILVLFYFVIKLHSESKYGNKTPAETTKKESYEKNSTQETLKESSTLLSLTKEWLEEIISLENKKPKDDMDYLVLEAKIGVYNEYVSEEYRIVYDKKNQKIKTSTEEVLNIIEKRLDKQKGQEQN